MASSVSSQSLLAAFASGLVFIAASVAVFLSFKNQGATLFRHALRLVLVIFFSCSGLWALTSFIATLIDTIGSSGLSQCHIAISFASSFDQLARIAFLQFLLWAICPAAKSLLFTLGLQGAIFLRFVLGGVFTGVQRPQFDPSCVARSIVMPLGVAILIVDCIFPTVFLIHAITQQPSQNAVGKVVGASHKTGSGTTKSHVLNIAAFGIWTAMSAPLMLALETLSLALRTVLPAVGLLIILVIIMIFNRDSPSQAVADEDTTKDVVDSYMRAGHSRKDSKPDIPSRKSSVSYSSWRPSGEVDGPVPMVQSQARYSDLNKALPSISQPRPGQQGVGVGGLPVQGQLFPRPRPEEPPNLKSLGRTWSKRNKKGKISISNPIPVEDQDRNPLFRVPTIDLHTAAENDKEKRRQQKEAIEMRNLAPARASKPVSTSPGQILQRSKSTGSARQQVAYAVTSPIHRRSLETIRESGATASTSSIQPSPRIEDMRRRSPQPGGSFDIRPSAPIPPLKTPGTLNSSFNMPNSPPTVKPAFIAELLAIPTELSAPLEPPPRSPLRVQKKQEEISMRPPEAERSSRPRSSSRSRSRSRSRSPGHHRRSSSVSSTRSKTRDIFFTDSGIPPAIPKDCAAGSLSGSIPSASLVATLRKSQSSSTTSVPGQAKHISPEKATKLRPRMSMFPKTPTRSQSKPAFSQMWVEQVSTLEMRPPKQAASAAEQGVFQLHNAQLEDPLAAHAAIAARCNTHRKTDSIVHRPRPIPRKPEDIISYYGMRRHNRRSLSCSSARSSSCRRSVLHSDAPCSPRHLPPLPPLPISAVNPDRPKPNDTKSMTFDEKVAMLFARSPSATSSSVTQKRRSSLPTIHSFATRDLVEDSSAPPENRLTKSTVRTASLFGEEEQNRHPSRGSAITAREWAGDTEYNSWNHSTPSSSGPKRRSSPVLPRTDLSPMSADNEWEEDDGASTVVPSVARLTVPHQIQNVSHFSATTTADTDFGVGEDEDDASIVEEGDEDFLSSEEPQSAGSTQQSFTPQYTKIAGSWHRRVGEPCPTFTSREGRAKPRKAPPPPPLRLWKPGQAPVFIEAEPSPLESPDEALKAIEEQLGNFNDSPQDKDAREQQRMTLLQDLEQEMGQQENEWQRMRHTMIRDSLSTVADSPMGGTSRPPSIPLIDRSSVGAVLASRFRSSNYSPISEDETAGPTLAQAQALILQRNLASQLEYRTSRLSAAGNKVNFLAISNPTTSQLGSPTPPDTDESDVESEVEVPLIIQGIGTENKHPMPRLWSPKTDTHVVAVNAMLWTSGPQPTSSAFALQNTPTKPRRTTRKTLNSMPSIMSKRLWAAPQPKMYTPKHTGLWKRTSVPPAPTTKPEPAPSSRLKLARKPVRKSRRLTQLPDILESPQPLPRSATLGIFQYPWGAPFSSIKSPASTKNNSRKHVTAMPGTMSSGGGAYGAYVTDFGLGVMARGQGSFFEDEDEEDFGDNFSDDEDDFDEGVLWEIASLLKTQRVLSPGDVSAEETGWPGAVSPVQESIPLVLDVKPLQSMSPTKPVRALWEDEKKSAKMERSKGLPQPDKQTWVSYLTEAPSQNARTPWRPNDELSQPVSQHLWKKAVAPRPSRSLLWSIPKPIEPLSITPQSPGASTKKGMLWSQSESSEPGLQSGLWAAPTSLPTEQSLWTPSAPTRRRKPTGLSLATVDSSALWSHQVPESKRSWLVSTSRIANASDPSTGLWVPITNTPKEGHGGLWRVPARHVRKPPAWRPSVAVRRRPTTKHNPIIIQSSTLWTSPTRELATKNWISSSSEVPKASHLWAKPTTSSRPPQKQGTPWQHIDKAHERPRYFAPMASAPPRTRPLSTAPSQSLAGQNLWALKEMSTTETEDATEESVEDIGEVDADSNSEDWVSLS